MSYPPSQPGQEPPAEQPQPGQQQPPPDALYQAPDAAWGQPPTPPGQQPPPPAWPQSPDPNAAWQQPPPSPNAHWQQPGAHWQQQPPAGQPQDPNAGWQQQPAAQPQEPNAGWQQQPAAQPQEPNAGWHQPPAAQPQDPNAGWQQQPPTTWAGQQQPAGYYPPGQPQGAYQQGPPYYPGAVAPPAQPSRPMITGWVALGAGLAAVIGSFLPWAKISAPIIGSISASGTDGSDGWITLALGAVLAAGAGLRIRGPRLPSVARIVTDVVAIGSALALLIIGIWKIVDLQSTENEMRESLTSGPEDPFGIGSAFSNAVQVNLGAGLVLITAAGLAGTIAMVLMLLHRRASTR
ncbi:hypothetical protein AB0J83_10485 [Actinoplanes sp. NPDC049596]|uniref:hypothetical protein n=1 Tax=unclassified Actinoplanes TaxID=2626549 RepID=UPI003432BF74